MTEIDNVVPFEAANTLIDRLVNSESNNSDQGTLSDTELVMSAYEDVMLEEYSPLKHIPIHESTIASATDIFESSSTEKIIPRKSSSSSNTIVNPAHDGITSASQNNTMDNWNNMEDAAASSTSTDSPDVPSKKKGEGLCRNENQQELLTADDPSTEISSFYGFLSQDTLEASEKENKLNTTQDSEKATQNFEELDPESPNTSVDEYLSAQSQPASPKKVQSDLEHEQSQSSMALNQPSSSGEESTTTDEVQRRYPQRTRKSKKILTYDTLGKPRSKPMSVDKAGEPRIKRFSIFAINNNPPFNHTKSK